jgi:hypothetical protein
MDGIYELPAILLSDECADIIRRAGIEGFQRARMAEVGRRNDEAFLIDSPYLHLLSYRLNARFKKIDVGRVLEVYRYGQGQEISAHVDEPQPLSSGRCSNMTLVVYLSDGFDGGSTVFPESGITLKPAVGGAFLFDQNLVHYAERVRSGFKYVARTTVAIEGYC